MIALTLKPVSPTEAREFIDNTLRLASYYHEITEDEAISRIVFFWDCLSTSIIKNPEEWGGLRLSDFSFVGDKADELKAAQVDKKWREEELQ